jgi:hypothetical protein
MFPITATPTQITLSLAALTPTTPVWRRALSSQKFTVNEIKVFEIAD